MSIFKKVKCLFYAKEDNRITTDEYECTVVLQSGIASFGIYETGLQILVSENVIKKVLLGDKDDEKDCSYIDFNSKDMELVNGKIKFNKMASKIRFQVLKKDDYFEIKIKDLKNILGT